MVNKIDRKGIKYLTYGKSIVIKYIHHCKNCGKDILLRNTEEKTAIGYCSKCVHKFKKKQSNSCSFNDKGEKHCKCCNRFLPINKFIKRKGRVGYSALCSKCHNLKKFGITSVDYENLLKKQNGGCAICGNPEVAKDKHKNTPRELAVDHDHKTGKIRGLLCTNHNAVLGHAKDNIEILKNCIKYLKQNEK